MPHTREAISSAVFAAMLVAASLSPAIAQPAPAPPSTRVILLGTNGGPTADPKRSEPANLLVVDGVPYLIDAGAGVSHQLALAGFPPPQVRHIFITHHHGDHNGGLVGLMGLDWWGIAARTPNAPPVEIYGPPATKFLVRTGLQYLSVFVRIFRAGMPALETADGVFAAHDIDHDGVVYQDNNVKVTAVENSHFYFKSGTPETGQDKSYSYRFDTPHGSVVFTGDTGPSDAVVKLAQGADLLVSEVNALNEPAAAYADLSAPPEGLRAQLAFHQAHEHLSPDEVGKMAAAAHVKAVLLTHFVPGTVTGDMTRFTAGVKKYFSGTVIAGQDLFEYDLDGQTAQ